MNCLNCLHYTACYACDRDYASSGIKSKAEIECESFSNKDLNHQARLKIGATVYCITEVPHRTQDYKAKDSVMVKVAIEHKVKKIVFSESGVSYMCKSVFFKESDIGKTVFTNKEKAREVANG